MKILFKKNHIYENICNISQMSFDIFLIKFNQNKYLYSNI